ncbi:hypothetical protein DdX_15831 [Ditylenchus destructor]|uniref:Uncharacterized protein n=1 Tax=Ditylenchus destructor TaxID=166010 RepID=A0AAD4MRG5_9BILA|nr:hypothetical protein DdX_15831 [Ditylenchus destructor]
MASTAMLVTNQCDNIRSFIGREKHFGKIFFIKAKIEEFFTHTHSTLVDDEYLICELSFNAGSNRWEWKKFSVEASQNLSPDEKALLDHLLDFRQQKRICFLYRNDTIGLIVQETDEFDEPFQHLILFNLDQRKFAFEKLYADEQENGPQWPPTDLIYLKSVVFRDHLLLFGSTEYETDGCAYIFGGVVRNKVSCAKIDDENSNENHNDNAKYVEVNYVQRIWLQPPALKKLAMLSIASALSSDFWTKTTKENNCYEPLFSEPIEFMRYVKDNVYKE